MTAVEQAAAGDVVDALAERQWRRMTRSSVPYAALTDGDKRACRALVEPILADVRELGLLADPSPPPP